MRCRNIVITSPAGTVMGMGRITIWPDDMAAIAATFNELFCWLWPLHGTKHTIAALDRIMAEENIWYLWAMAGTRQDARWLELIGFKHYPPLGVPEGHELYGRKNDGWLDAERARGSAAA
jgi:hypothetical protein